MASQKLPNSSSYRTATRATIPETQSPPSSLSPPVIDQPLHLEKQTHANNRRYSQNSIPQRDSRSYRHYNERDSRPLPNYSSQYTSRTNRQDYSNYHDRNYDDRSYRDSPSRRHRTDHHRYQSSYRKYDDHDRRTDRPSSYYDYKRDYRNSHDSYDRRHYDDNRYPAKRMRRYSDQPYKNDSSRNNYYPTSYGSNDSYNYQNRNSHKPYSRQGRENGVTGIRMDNVYDFRNSEQLINHFKSLRPTQAQSKEKHHWVVDFQEPQHPDDVLDLARKVTETKYIELMYQDDRRNKHTRTENNKRPREESNRTNSRFHDYEHNQSNRTQPNSEYSRDTPSHRNRNSYQKESSYRDPSSSRNREDDQRRVEKKTYHKESSAEKVRKQHPTNSSQVKPRSHTPDDPLSKSETKKLNRVKDPLVNTSNNSKNIVDEEKRETFSKLQTREELFSAVLSEFTSIVRRDIVQLRSFRYRGTVNKITKEAVRSYQKRKEEEKREKITEITTPKSTENQIKKDSHISIPRADRLKTADEKLAVIEKRPRTEDNDSPKVPHKKKRVSRFSGTGITEPETSVISPSSHHQSQQKHGDDERPQKISDTSAKRIGLKDSIISSDLSTVDPPTREDEGERRQPLERAEPSIQKEIKKRKTTSQQKLRRKGKHTNSLGDLLPNGKSVSTCDPLRKSVYSEEDAASSQTKDNEEILAIHERSRRKSKKLKKKIKKSRVIESDDDDSIEESESIEKRSHSCNNVEQLETGGITKNKEKIHVKLKRNRTLKLLDATAASDKDSVHDHVDPSISNPTIVKVNDKGRKDLVPNSSKLKLDSDGKKKKKIFLRLRIAPPRTESSDERNDGDLNSNDRKGLEAESSRQKEKEGVESEGEDGFVSARTAGLLRIAGHWARTNKTNEKGSRKDMPSAESSRENRQQSRRFRKGINHFNMKNDLLTPNSLCQRKKSVFSANSGIHGMGLYANEAIEFGEFVIEYIGDVIRPAVAEKREIVYTRQGMGDSYLFRLSADMVVDATRKGGIARFINHSCDPNLCAKIITVGTNRKIVFYSNRKISKGNELTYDYKFDFEGEDKKIPCYCGAATCRKFLN